MRFGFTDEQEQFRDAVRRWLHDHSPSSEVRRLMATTAGYERASWVALSTDLGLCGLQVPVTYGGQGFGFGELGIALEEMGRKLACLPYFSTCVLATQAILHGADEAHRTALLPTLCDGTRTASLAWVEADGQWEPAATSLTATPAGDAFRLDGTKTCVIDGHTADVLIVLARTAGVEGDAGLVLCAVDAPTAGLERRLLTTIDTTRKLAELRFDGVPARAIGAPGTAAAAMARTLDEAAALLACEMIGGARSLLESAVDYAGLRMQFGRPIGSFQAIKHKCAELLLEVELAHAGACYAVAAFDEGDAEAPALAALAKACAADAYLQAAIDCIQIHGGIGFTWDHDAHLWFKRAKSSEVMLGLPDAHRERYLHLLEAAA